MKTIRMVCVFLAFLSLALSLSAQTFTTLHSFDYTDGAGPFTGMVQGTDGNLFGVTSAQGPYSGGTVFKMTPAGALTTLYDFCILTLCEDGQAPIGGLIQASNGDFYGTTSVGGANVYGGTVFQITPGGTLTTLYSFCPPPYNCADGEYPGATMLQTSSGSLYGTTVLGGAYYTNNGNTPGAGTVFKITTGGALTTLHSFDTTDGFQPYASVIQATDGNFYSTASEGGAYGYGTVFKITPSGAFSILHSFCAQTSCTDGGGPYGQLVQATNGSIYGTTTGGGTYGFGTVYKITPSGVFTKIYDFCTLACLDGNDPIGGLMQASDGNLYGTTYKGGASSNGTIFKITPGGALTTLYSFCAVYPSCADGSLPYSALVQDTNGIFYGTTTFGGADNAGSIFRLNVGLAPFVSAEPGAGGVGATIRVRGQGFTGTTGVSFNGKAATYRVWSETYLTATIPSGATTGFVTAVTPTGTLKSNKTFRVTPQFTSFTPPSGAVGSEVILTGVSLAQTTRVTFGGVSATTFTVNSDTQVTATVPTGAATGKIVITTAGGTATSATSFTVTP